jgi:hypothetical protein
MTLEDLKLLLQLAEADLQDKGYTDVRVCCYVEPNRDHWFSLSYRKNPDDRETVSLYPKVMSETLASIPSRLDLLRAEFLKRLATLVEDAEMLELQIPELRPLFETYKNNELEFQK